MRKKFKSSVCKPLTGIILSLEFIYLLNNQHYSIQQYNPLRRLDCACFPHSLVLISYY